MADGIKDKVAIVGMGCTRFGEHWDKGPSDLVIEAVNEALADAGIGINDIQAFWGGTLDSGSGGRAYAEALRMQYKPATRVENACASGTEAVRGAAYAVAAGAYDICLALGFEKLKDEGLSGLPGMQNRTGTHFASSMPGVFAIMATRYFNRYGLTPQEGKAMIGRVSVKSHHNGSLNPKAHHRKEITLEQVLKAPIIAYPLGLFDCCGVSDGAAAAVIVRADMVKSFPATPVYVKALQICCGPSSGRLRQDYDYTHVEEACHARAAAYAEAGVTNARQEISLAEVHDCFSITEAVTMEDLEFSPRGGVREDIESGFFDLDGPLPVQPDGGLKCFGHPIGASGIRMLYEPYLQFQGKAGPRQIKDPKLALTHNMGGEPYGPVVSVCIVGL